MERESKFFNETSRESEPKIHFRILYGPHNSPEDLKALEEELSRADIYFPENAGWNIETERAYQAYATGKYEVPGNLEPALKFELETLSRLGKAGREVVVGLVDLPEGHSLLKRPESSEKALLKFETGNFVKAIQEIKRIAENNARLNKQREDYIQAQIQSKIQSILEAHPLLKEKTKKEGKLNVLLSLGTVHTRISHNLKKEGKDVERRFNQLPYEFGSFHELARRYLFGKEVNDELAARALLFSELLPDVAFSDDTTKIYRVANKITSRFKLSDIKKISSKIKSGISVVKAVEGFGAHIPRSEKEMNEFLGEKK